MTWPPGRRLVAGLATLAALATSGLGVAVAAGGWVLAAAAAHLVAAALALVQPRLAGAQVTAGVAVAWSILPGREGTVVVVVPVVAGVVATAELIGLAGWLGTVLRRPAGPGLVRVVLATMVAAAACGLTLAAGALDGPGGLAATVLAASAVVALAVLARATLSAEPPRRGTAT